MSPCVTQNAPYVGCPHPDFFASGCYHSLPVESRRLLFPLSSCPFCRQLITQHVWLFWQTAFPPSQARCLFRIQQIWIQMNVGVKSAWRKVERAEKARWRKKRADKKWGEGLGCIHSETQKGQYWFAFPVMRDYLPALLTHMGRCSPGVRGWGLEWGRWHTIQPRICAPTSLLGDQRKK